jgi:hypothetical protein
MFSFKLTVAVSSVAAIADSNLDLVGSLLFIIQSIFVSLRHEYLASNGVNFKNTSVQFFQLESKRVKFS